MMIIQCLAMTFSSPIIYITTIFFPNNYWINQRDQQINHLTGLERFQLGLQSSWLHLELSRRIAGDKVSLAERVKRLARSGLKRQAWRLGDKIIYIYIQNNMYMYVYIYITLSYTRNEQYLGIFWNTGTPSHHPFAAGIFHCKPSSELGVPHLWKPPPLQMNNYMFHWGFLRDFNLFIMLYQYLSGWWFGTFFIFPYIGNVIIPIDELIFFWGLSSTTNQCFFEQTKAYPVVI